MMGGRGDISDVGKRKSVVAKLKAERDGKAGLQGGGGGSGHMNTNNSSYDQFDQSELKLNRPRELNEKKRRDSIDSRDPNPHDPAKSPDGCKQPNAWQVKERVEQGAGKHRFFFTGDPLPEEDVHKKQRDYAEAESVKRREFIAMTERDPWSTVGADMNGSSLQEGDVLGNFPERAGFPVTKTGGKPRYVGASGKSGQGHFRERSPLRSDPAGSRPRVDHQTVLCKNGGNTLGWAVPSCILLLGLEGSADHNTLWLLRATSLA